VKRLLDVREMRLRGRRDRRRARDPPARRLQRGRSAPAFGFDERFHAIAGVPRLQIEALGPNAIVERRQRNDRVAARGLDEHERRREAAIALRSEEVAALKRISEQHLVVARIEERRAAGGHAAARHAAKDHGYGFHRPIHFGGGRAVDVAVGRTRQPVL
jgi:hypothetical protein